MVFEVADYESIIRFQNSRWRIQYGERKSTKSRNWMKIDILVFLRSLIMKPLLYINL